MIKKLKINFILPFIAKSGGIAVVLEYTLQLRRKGHEVRLYYPLLPYGSQQFHSSRGSLQWTIRQAKSLLKNILHGTRPIPWFREPIKATPVPFIHSLFLRDADATIATAWPTAYDVAGFPRSKGEKFYFVQDYEIWNSDPGLVDGSYQLPLNLITIAPWLSTLMVSRFGRRAAAEIHNGINLDIYHPLPDIGSKREGILMMYHVLESKASGDGLKALAMIHAEWPDVPIRAFGMFQFPEGWNFVEYHRDPSLSEVLDLYRKSAVFLSPSRSEGWGLPVMEAMACGCAVVATEVGCVPVLKEAGNMLTAAPGDTQTLHRHLDSLVRDSVLRKDVAAKGLATISRHGWSEPARRLEELLLSNSAGS